MVPHSASPSEYAWLEADAPEVARALIGWELISQIGATVTAGRIVETEAYHGLIDPASHAFRGPTRRTAPMFAAGGAVYVYVSYGIHRCMNIVTGPAGEGQAVLIRALEPTIGRETMAVRRGTLNPLQLCSGPGKLAQALGIGLDLSGTRLGQTISLKPPVRAQDPNDVIAAPRIGISRAKDLPWRFYLNGNPHVSRK